MSAATALVANLFKPQLLKAVDALLDQTTDNVAALASHDPDRTSIRERVVL